jgi:FdhE protein
VTKKNPLDGLSAEFERRAARAVQLAEASEAAAAPLIFSAGLYRAQSALASVIAGSHTRRPLVGVPNDDLGEVVPDLRRLLRFAGEHAPAGLASIAGQRAREETVDLHARLRAFWTGETRDDYLSRALLRPYVETLAGLNVRPDRTGPVGSCPFCGGLPWIASRRAGPEGAGAQRYLGCALCGGEWVANRVRCVACLEENPTKLLSYTSDRHPTVRIEACDGCRRYVKSLDLTLDGRLVPEVDDLVSIAMDLWARENGYSRIEPGLAGV